MKGLLCAIMLATGVEEVVSELQRNHQAFLSLPGLRVEYRMTYQHVRGQRQFSNPLMELLNIRSGEKVYAAARDQDGSEWKAAWNGTVGTKYSGSAYRINSVPLSALFYIQYYVDHLFYPDAHAKMEDPEGIVYVPGYTGGPDYWIPDALERNQAKYRLSPQAEYVDGAPCLVLEWPRRDRLWIDPALGYAIRRRDFRRTDGALRDQVVLREFEQVAESLWLPKLIIRRQFCSTDDPPRLWNQVSGTRTIRVSELRVEEIPDEQFLVEVPPGARVDDMVRDLDYQSLQAGDDPIAEAEAEVLRRLRGTAWWTYALYTAGIVGLLVAGVFAYRRWVLV